MVRSNSVSDMVDAEEMTDEKIPWLGLVFQQREEMFNDTFVNSVQVFDIERVVRKGYVGLECGWEDGRPRAITQMLHTS